jgi:hypothetical protein
MNGLDPIPHLKVTKGASRLEGRMSSLQNKLRGKRWVIFLTHWHAENGQGERERNAGYFCFDKLTCILCFVNDEESGHC